MSDNIEDYMAQVHNFDFAPGDQSAALENAFQQANNNENRQRTSGDDRNLASDARYFAAENTQDSSTNGGNTAHSSANIPNQFNRDGGQQFDVTRNNYQAPNNDGRDQRGGYGDRPEHSSDERNNNGQPNASVSHNGSSVPHSNQPQYSSSGMASVAALPIPAMALQVSSLSGAAFVPNPALQQQPPPQQQQQHQQHGPPPAPIMEGPLLKSRCIEEEYAVILHRSASAAAKSSNTKYRCLFCNFTFVGGPQKIRVHLTGKRENGTRLSKCENCPEDIRRRLEERMKAPKEIVNEIGLYDDDDASTPSLPARNVEEQHTIVLSRSQSSNSKSSNTRYKCIYCRFKFVGGPQKIRVHLTGQQEGGTRMNKCARVPEEVMEQMEHRRKAPKPDVLSTPSGLPAPLPLPHLGGDPDMHPALSAIQSQHAYAIQQQQQALLKQQQQHAQQLQIQQQQLQILQRQQQMQLHQQQQQQQMHQQHIQHLQQIHHQQQLQQQQQQQQMHQQHIQLPHGAVQHPAAQMHPAHLQQQHLMHLGQAPTSAAQQLMMQQQQQQHHLQQQQLQRQHQHQQQQQMQHPHLPHHQQIPPHLIFHNAQVNSAAAQHAQHAQSLQSHVLHQHQQQQQQQQLHQQQLHAHPHAHLMQGAGHHVPNLAEYAEQGDEVAVAAYHAEILAAQAAAALGDAGAPAEQQQGQGQRQAGEHQQQP